MRTIAVWAATCVVALLTACGGGGGGGGTPTQTPQHIAALPTSATLTGSSTGGLPAVGVSLSVEGGDPPQGDLIYVATGSDKGLVTGRYEVSALTLYILGVDSGTLDAGTYTDTLTVKLCYDLQCDKQANVTPVRIPVTYVVTQGDPTTTGPTIISTSPGWAAVGGGDTIVTLSGKNFTPQSVVRWNDQVISSTYVSVHRMDVTVPAADLTSVMTGYFTVSNERTGGTVGPAQGFEVRSPTPTVSALSTSTASRGGSSFLLKVTGTDFDGTSRVTWNGTARPTAYVSATLVTAQITAADLASSGDFPVAVYNVDGGSIASNSLDVKVADAALSAVSLLPASVTAAGPAYLQSVVGSGFDASSTVNFNGSPRTTTFISTTRIAAQLTAADVASAGAATITVTSGGGNPATSGSLTLTITGPTTDSTAVMINPQHSGAMIFANIVAPSALPSSPTWNVPLDGRADYALIAGGRVFATVVAPNHPELVALNASTGATLWGPVTLSGTVAGATYDNDRVITLASDGVLTAYDAANGTVLWATQLCTDGSPSLPTAANGVVYADCADGSLRAIDDTTGAELWTATIYNYGNAPTVTPNGIFLSFVGETYAFQPATGAALWYVPSSIYGGGGNPGSYANGVYYSPDGVVTTGQIFDPTTGKTLTDYTGTPALGTAMGYFLRSGTLTAVELSTGASRWTFVGDGTLTSVPVLVNGYVFVESSAGKLYALDATTGSQLWTTSLGAVDWGVNRGFMTAGNGLLVLPVDKSLTAYRLSANP